MTAPAHTELREAIARELYRQIYPGAITTHDTRRTPESDLVEADRAYDTWDQGSEGFAPGRRCRRYADALIAGPLAPILAVHGAVETIKGTGGAVEISGVRIEPCDEYGTTVTTAQRDEAQMERADALRERDFAQADLAEVQESFGSLSDELHKVRGERDDLVIEAIRQKGRANTANRKLAAVRELTDEIEHSEWGVTSNEAIVRLRRILDAATPAPEETA